MQFYDYFLQLCARKGVTPTKATKEMNLSNATATRWANRGSVPNASTLMRIALYFDIPYSEITNYEAVDYAPSSNTDNSTQLEQTIDAVVRKLPVVKQDYLLKYLQLTFPEAFNDEV